jgi:hypothetical protein
MRMRIVSEEAPPAQQLAWRWLWRRLLGPENNSASEGPTPEAPNGCAADDAAQRRRMYPYDITFAS